MPAPSASLRAYASESATAPLHPRPYPTGTDISCLTSSTKPAGTVVPLRPAACRNRRIVASERVVSSVPYPVVVMTYGGVALALALAEPPPSVHSVSTAGACVPPARLLAPRASVSPTLVVTPTASENPAPVEPASCIRSALPSAKALKNPVICAGQNAAACLPAAMIVV